MKVLLLADREERALWDFYDPGRTEGVDLIISCGDLDADYLEFLVTMVSCPLLYVRGNHDRDYDRKPPRGCVDIDDTVMIDPSDRLLLPPHFALNALGGGKQIMRTEWREAQHGGIGEEMLRGKSPRLSDIKS